MSSSARDLAQRSQVEQLRRKAAQLRATAVELRSAISRSMVVALAEEYEALATRVERSGKRRRPVVHP